MGDRCAAQTRFIRENAALEPHQNHLTQGTADSRFS